MNSDSNKVSNSKKEYKRIFEASRSLKTKNKYPLAPKQNKVESFIN